MVGFRDVEGDQASRAPGGNYVVALGIDRYRHWPQLSNAVGDARGALAAFERLGFAPFRAPLLDGDATAAAIRKLVNDELPNLASGDSLVLFLAGHGHTQVRTFEDGDRVKTGYFIAADAEAPGGSLDRWLRLDTLLSEVARLPPKHILVFLDACHSGIALGSIIKWRSTAQRSEGLEPLSKRRSRRVITSALDDQRALDGGPVAGHSLFTGCLIEGLDGGIASPGAYVTGSEIGMYLQSKVASYPGSTQTPDFGALEEDKRGELILQIVADPASKRSVARPTTDRAVTPLRVEARRGATVASSGCGWAPTSRLVLTTLDAIGAPEAGATYAALFEPDREVPVELCTFDRRSGLAVLRAEVDLPMSPTGSPTAGEVAWRAPGFRGPAPMALSGRASSWVEGYRVLGLTHDGPPPMLDGLPGAPVTMGGVVVATLTSQRSDAVLHAVPISAWNTLHRCIATVHNAGETFRDGLDATARTRLVDAIAELARRELGQRGLPADLREQLVAPSGDGVRSAFESLHRLFGTRFADLVKQHTRQELTGTDIAVERAVPETPDEPSRSTGPWTWELHIRTPALPGVQIRKLDPGESLVIGRDEACDLQLSDPQVSRHHARIDAQVLMLQVTDFDSKHGTMIDDRSVRGTGVAVGSNVIRVGETSILVVSQASRYMSKRGTSTQ